jgi:hypothetical protein
MRESSTTGERLGVFLSMHEPTQRFEFELTAHVKAYRLVQQ